jgi:hypothetical protein
MSTLLGDGTAKDAKNAKDHAKKIRIIHRRGAESLP